MNIGRKNLTAGPKLVQHFTKPSDKNHTDRMYFKEIIVDYPFT